MVNLCRAAFLFLVVIGFGAVYSYGQPGVNKTPELKAEEKVPWTLTVVVMDGTEMHEKAEIPVKEAVEFVEKHSRFAVTVKYVTTNVKHDYTTFKGGRDFNGDGKPDQNVSYMLGWNVPRSLVRTLPVSSSYLFLYKLFGRLPAQAGSAMGLEYGLLIGGKMRPWATAPTDQSWYVNEPKLGFRSWAAQILAHEIVNTIQAKLEKRPYRCGQLTGSSGTDSYVYEGERLTKITDACYAKLGNNAN